MKNNWNLILRKRDSGTEIERISTFSGNFLAINGEI